MPEKKKEIKKVEIDPIQCVWGLICSMSVTDKDTNNVSLFNIVEQFNLPEDAFSTQKKENKTLVFPTQYEIILFFRRTLNIDIFDDQILGDLKIKTVDPNGNTVQETTSSVTFPKAMKKLRFRVVMAGLSFTNPGNYIHQIEMKLSTRNNFSKLLEIPFEILEKKIR